MKASLVSYSMQKEQGAPIFLTLSLAEGRSSERWPWSLRLKSSVTQDGFVCLTVLRVEFGLMHCRKISNRELKLSSVSC